MYYYKSKSSESAMGSYKLKDVIECKPFERDHTAFYIVINYPFFIEIKILDIQNKEWRNEKIGFQS